MGKIIAVANQKGGVGKTTTCVNLCCALKNRGKRVLLCDCDPQGNSTSGMGVDKSSSPGVYDILINEVPARDATISTKYGDLLPSSMVLSAALVELVGVIGREFVLKEALIKVRDEYDYILIDCPPSLELLTLNALCAADSVLVPMQCEYYAMEGLKDLLETMRIIKARLNTSLKIEGILLTMYDSRTRLSGQVAEELKKYMGDRVYSATIPRNVRLSEAPSHGKPVLAYDRASKGARAYLKFASEFLQKQG